MNFGQKGRELLQELRRSDWLPLYSEDAVSRCLLECQGHMAQIRPALAQEMVSEYRWSVRQRLSGHILMCDDAGNRCGRGLRLPSSVAWILQSYQRTV
eukprot:evm.model.NODE_7120_length_16464_cov_72.988220.3